MDAYPKGRITDVVKGDSADDFFQSLAKALGGAKITAQKSSGVTRLVTLVPLSYITMEECAALRESFSGVVDVSLIPNGVKVTTNHREPNHIHPYLILPNLTLPLPYPSDFIR